MAADELIETYYKKYNFPGSAKLYQLLKKDGVSITKKSVDEFLSKKTEVQQTKIISNKRSNDGKIVSYRPFGLLQFDIYDLSKYTNKNGQPNHGNKYILSIMDVFTRKAWAYPMKNKDSINVYSSFEKFIKNSNIKKYTESSFTKLMSDNDSSFMTKEFQELLQKNNIIHDPNTLNDHHALGLIDSFARILKITFTKLFLQNNNTNWVDHLDEIINNYNNTPHSSLNNIEPNKATTTLKNEQTILKINTDKSVFNRATSDLEKGDRVRKITALNIFRKGTEPRYSNEVFIVESVRGKQITLNDDSTMKRTTLLKVPNDTPLNNKGPNIINIVNTTKKIERILKQDGVDESNIIKTSRR